uniref:Uncharacterized protein n=1 Tax=Lepeophtheirus salmonis TaxID=72036 RepID=A0A0K2UUZ1_LEPSM
MPIYKQIQSTFHILPLMSQVECCWK